MYEKRNRTGGRIAVVLFLFILSLLTILPSVKALNADRFLVLNDGACTPTQVATNAGCWAATSGGVGGAGVPGSTDRALLDANSGAGAGNLNGNMNVKDWCTSSACNGGANFGGTLNMLSAVITIQRHWNSNGGTMVVGLSTVVFAGSGTLATKNNGAYGVKDLYNVTVNIGVSTTFTTPVGVANIFRLNGTLISSGGDPQRIFNVFGVSGTSTPVIKGPSADFSQSGYFYYSVESTSNFDVLGATYQHLGVRGAPNITATMTGPVITGVCGNSLDCAMIINAIVPGTRFTFKTNNFDLTIGGTFFIGDGHLFPAYFYAGSSRIEAHGIDPTGPGVSYFQSSTLIAHTSPDTCGGSYPRCLTFYQSFASVSYLQNAVLTSSEGEIHLFDTSAFYANASAINFVILTVEPTAHLWKDGLDVSNLQFSSSAGYVTISKWLTNNRPSQVKWNMSVSDPAGLFTAYIGDMTPVHSYSFSKDGVIEGTQDSNNIGTFAFSTTFGDTSSHQIEVAESFGGVVLRQAVDIFWLFIFTASMALLVVGAWKVRQWRQG